MNDSPGAPKAGGEPLVRTVTIVNQRGLHARAAAKFVKVAGYFDAAVTVTRAGQSVSGHSIMGLMMLAAAPGSEIEIETSGAEAEGAMNALVALVEGKFEED